MKEWRGENKGKDIERKEDEPEIGEGDIRGHFEKIFR